MRHLLNTLFVLTPESYLMLDGENIVLKNKEDTSKRFPLHYKFFLCRGKSCTNGSLCKKRNRIIVFYAMGEISSQNIR